MAAVKSRTIFYKRSRFVTHLPVDYLYAPSHCWVERLEGGLCRVGLTKFATRMLGDMVDAGFEPKAGEAVQTGQIIGWVEGFKAISDVFCVVDGNFAGSNPVLEQKVATVSKDPYLAGWLYAAHGTPAAQCLDVQAYLALLDKTIDKILEKQKSETIE